MKDHNVFDISDYAAQKNPGWRVRWGAEGYNAVLLVDTTSPKTDSRWKLVWCDEDPDITLSNSGEFVITNAVTVHEETRTITSCQGIPAILARSYTDHFLTNVAAPRRKNPEPYIRKEEAEIMEKGFFDSLVAPYLDSHTTYSVHDSGTRLCHRLNIPVYSEIFISHYDSTTLQRDSEVKVGNLPIEHPDMPVLVIDDMVSSGHTAAAILDAFAKAGVTRVRYVALFNIVASRENHDVDSAIETWKDISNFYWMYGRGMDLLDDQSRRTLHIYGADKSYDSASESEDVDDLLNFFNKQS